MQGMDFALAQITDRVRAAAADQTPLRLRGGGTKDFWGHALQGDVLDTRVLRGILSYEPSELVVTVRAGTPLAELEAALAEQGQCLPFEPPISQGPPLREPRWAAWWPQACRAPRVPAWGRCVTICWASRCSTAGPSY
ncbi:FAD linked oxidase domain-containing protein [Acidovorax sp. NO-1]|nr:FAD linked oxidase domain-containing protein [Acidovorax sp. NO-1]